MKTLVYLLKEDSEETVTAIGLLQRLQGGMTQSEVEIRVETVH